MTVSLAVDAVLFDMDGTLVDSNALVDVVWTEFAQAHGLDRAEVLAFAHGRPSRATVAHYLTDEAEISRWNDHIHHLEATMFDAVAEIPGARALVEALPRGRWAVVTSAIREPARERIGAVGIDVPAVLIGADDVERGKPDPEGYVAAARRLGVDPSRCVVFEDTDAGIRAGLAAGCTTVVVGDSRSDVLDQQVRVRDLSAVTAVLDGDALTLHIDAVELGSSRS